jgi:tetratricopeptide (TPR) repeat protein
LLFALSVTAVAQEAPAALDPTLAEARALIDGGDPRAAIRKLEALNRSADPRVALMLGVASYHANDHARAIEHLSPVIDQLPADSLAQREAIQVLGLAHYLAGHLAAAIPLLERTRAFSPHNAELAYVLGMACVQTRRIECARESFARMFRVEAKSAAAHLVTAQMMLRVEFEEDAVAELKESLAKDPRLSGPNYLLGQIAIHRARYDEAIALLGRELEINPANAMAYYRLGDAYTRQLKWEEATEPLQKSIWLNPYFSGPYILLGKTYLKRRQLPTAEGMLRRAIQFDPNNKSAHYLLGQVYQQMRRAEDARRQFAIAEKLQGDRENPER